ncbi:uncharacterized protein LOC143052296 isoform X2 [Mytilus galloprovincialis]
MEPAAIAGTTVGSIVGIILMVLAGIYRLRKCKEKRRGGDKFEHAGKNRGFCCHCLCCCAHHTEGPPNDGPSYIESPPGYSP